MVLLEGSFAQRVHEDSDAHESCGRQDGQILALSFSQGLADVEGIGTSQMRFGAGMEPDQYRP